MVSVAALVGLVVILVVNTAIAALATRFFRFQLATQWGAAVFTAVFVPVLYVVTTLVLGGLLGLGEGLFRDVTTLITFTWGLPFALGVAIDVFWMPPPEEVELPAARQQDDQRQ